MTPEAVIDVVKSSGLRGRGGGGFPTGRKWEFNPRCTRRLKYVICNADEGDPEHTWTVASLKEILTVFLKVMIIGAYAIGSNEGYVY